MKLAHVELEKIFDFGIGCVLEWIIETPELFSEYLQELLKQQNGQEGRFVLSNNDKTLDISKCVEVILNPFSVDINDKKILNKLYVELNELAFSEQFYIQTQELVFDIYQYLFELEQETEYMLTTEDEIDFTAVFKAVGMKHEVCEDNFWETLTRYIKIITEVLKVKLIVLVNIRSFLSDEQVQEFIKTVMYEEVGILLLENQERTCICGLQRYIIDKDKCEIY